MQINHTPKDSQGAGDAKLGLKHKMLALLQLQINATRSSSQPNGKIDIFDWW